MKRRVRASMIVLALMAMVGEFVEQSLAQENKWSIRASIGPAYFPLTRTQNYIRRFANGNGEFRGSRTAMSYGMFVAYRLDPNLSLVFGAKMSELDQEYFVTAGKPQWGRAAWHFRSIPFSTMIEYNAPKGLLGLTPFGGVGVSCLLARLHQSSDFAAVDGERAAVQFLNEEVNSFGLDLVVAGGVSVDLSRKAAILVEARYAGAVVLPGLSVYEVRWSANRVEMPVDLSALSLSTSIVWRF